MAHTFIKKLRPGDVVIIAHEGKEKIKRISELKDDEVFVLGDHLETSTDSRHFGWLQISDVKARVFWPKSKIMQTHS